MTNSPTPSQPSSSSQPSKDPSDWLALAASIKSKMSTRRSAHSAIVEAHSPAASATSAHRRHHPKQPSQQHFDMTQLQHSISVLASEPEVQKSPRTRIASTPAATNGKEAPSVGGDPTVKKERIKNLWGKVGKQGMLQAAAAKQPAAGLPPKWDQVLNPLLQKQKQERMVFANDPAAAAAAAAHAAYLSTTVGGEAGGGSGFYGQPGNPTMECDCGDDSCPQCNLMLNMGSNGPAW